MLLRMTPMSTPPQPYQRCMVMAGGGFRFGIYLGMFEALRQAGRAPDVILASCGGAIAATIIRNLPDDAARRAWLTSPDMYRFWCGLRSTPRAKLAGTLLRAARRRLSPSPAPLVPDLFGDYLFELPPQLPFPPEPARPTVDVAILGGRLLFGPEQVGQPRAGRKLYAETVFCGERAAALLAGMDSPLSDPRWGRHAVARELLTDGSVPVAAAARISISDMLYFRSQRHGAHEYIGGVVDLFPVEIARRLASEVVLEFKEAFEQMFSIPAWRSVLGLDGNARLRYANSQLADMRIDSSDVSAALPSPLLQKLDWRRNRIELAMTPDHASFVELMDAQWRYGYERAMEACARPPRQQPAIRSATRHSKAHPGA